MYAKIINNAIQHYPSTVLEVRAYYPDVAFPQLECWDNCEFLQDEGWHKVQPTEQPVYNPLTETVTEVAPELIDGVLMQTWQVIPLTTEQLQSVREALVSQLDAAITEQLDEQCRALDFESMLDAQGYTQSITAQWADQAQSLCEWRDECWIWFSGIDGQSGIKAAILAGTETRTLTDLLAELPLFNPEI